MSDHPRHFAARQSRKRVQGYVRAGGPRAPELRPVGNNKQDTGAINAANGQLKQLKRRGIYPVRILEDAQHWTLDRNSQEHLDELAYRPVLYLLRRELGQFVTIFGGNRQQIG